jgi:hypothetical protein
VSLTYRSVSVDSVAANDAAVDSASEPAAVSGAQVNPAKILKTGFAFWSSKVLLTAVEMDVFTTLSGRSLTGVELGKTLGLHQRGIYDFFDTLVAMGFLERDGDGTAGRYRNTPSTAQFLDKNQPGYLGGPATANEERARAAGVVYFEKAAWRPFFTAGKRRDFCPPGPI